MGADSIDLRSVLQLLRRRIWLIVLTTLVCLGLSGAALFALKPVYTATALVLIDPSKKNLLDADAQLAGSSSDSLRVDSEVELVKSETTLLEVARQLDLANDVEFGPRIALRDMLLSFFRIAEPKLPSGDEALRSVMSNLRDAITVQRRGLTFLIAVSGRSARADFAAKLANAAARTYIDQQLEAKIASTLASRDKIQATLSEASANVARSESAFDDLIDQNLSRISESTGRTDLLDLRRQIDDAAQFRTDAASAAATAEQSLKQRDWASVASSLKDQAVANLERQREALVASLDQAEKGTQAAVDLQASLKAIEASLETTATAALSNLQQDVQQSQGQVSTLRGQLRTSVLGSDLPPDILTSIYGAQQAGSIARAQYQMLLTRQNDLDTQAALQVPDGRLVAEATTPAAPSFPNPRLILILAGLGGIALGIGIAVLIENYFGGFTSDGQAEAILKLPVAATIPRLKETKRGGGEMVTVADALIMAPLSVFSESIRRVRVGVDQATRRSVPHDEETGAGRVIVVSSAAPGEGKTTTALSLARAYALSGLSTLIIDCDLRKPSIHRQLGMEASEGLLEYLVADSDSADLRSIMTIDAGSRAQVILGSRRSDIATDQLIAGRTFSRLVAAARKNFDVIVLDTPPVGPVVDGLYLASMADAIVFVVKWSSTPQQEVRSAVAALLGAKRPETAILAVLNQQDSNPRAYRAKYAGYYGEA
ncbi:Wzz/FepE/Etk N-terminal domain-containing protein [Devosia sp.]|uniref:Wzz/FepE/Etk N-terminal domain-containing protein n=1 Tax=Devosia sp. TaxID=1871048 RepID=UPI003BA97ABC